jgi:hypothetical protein
MAQKSGVQNKAGINFKKYRTPALPKCPVNILYRRPAGREIDRSQYAQGVEENNKRYQENPQLYRTTRDKRTYIRYYKRQWGYNHTNLTGLEK